MDEQKAYKLECVRESLKNGLAQESFTGQVLLDAYFVKRIEKGKLSEELTDPHCLALHDMFCADSITDGTLEGLPTILFRFRIDFDAQETIDKLAEYVCGYYVSGSSVMPVQDFARFASIKFIQSLIRMRRNSDFVPCECNDDGFRVSYLYRDEHDLDKLREHVHEILYWNNAGGTANDDLYKIYYTSRIRDKESILTLSLGDFNEFKSGAKDATSAVREYANDFLECVKPKEGTYVSIRKVELETKEEPRVGTKKSNLETEEEKQTPKKNDDVLQRSNVFQFENFFDFHAFCEQYKNLDGTPRFIVVRDCEEISSRRFCRVRVQNGMVQFSIYAFDDDYPFDDGRVWQRPRTFYDDVKGNFGYDFELALS